MNIPLLENRVRSLEEMMADLIATSENTSRIAAQTSLEMKAFKEEMKEEMTEFKDRVEQYIERIDRDIEESKRDRAERKLEQRRFNQELGAIARKQGRMAEDLVAPSICRILRQLFKIPMMYECGEVVRYRRIHPEDGGRMKEFDVIGVCGDYVMVNETKSKPEPSNIPELLETIREFREYFPEYKDKKIIGSLATLYADDSLVKYASREGILILAVGEELMDVMNEPGFKPAEF
jgi:hypothetical protein